MDEATGDLTIETVRATDMGNYTCTATNEVGVASDTVEVSVRGEQKPANSLPHSFTHFPRSTSHQPHSSGAEFNIHLSLMGTPSLPPFTHSQLLPPPVWGIGQQAEGDADAEHSCELLALLFTGGGGAV